MKKKIKESANTRNIQHRMKHKPEGYYAGHHLPRCKASSRRMELSTATKMSISGANTETKTGPFFPRHHDSNGNAAPDATKPCASPGKLTSLY